MPLLDKLLAEIVETARPSRVLLFSQKTCPDGSPSSVKLCVIIPDGDPRAVEHRLYMEIEAELSFDVLVYTAQQWERLARTPYSLAARADKAGRVLYEAK